MPRFGIEKESGDAKLRVLESKMDLVAHKTVSEQRTDFARFMKNYKSPKTNQEYDDEKMDVDENHDLGGIHTTGSVVPLIGNDGDHSEKASNSKCSEGGHTATRLDQVMELRSELDARVAELSQFRAELREVSQLLNVDPFTSTKKSARAESSNGSVATCQATALQHCIQSFCGQPDSQAPNM